MQALVEESCVQSVLYASISRKKTAPNPVFGSFPVKNYSKQRFKEWLSLNTGME
jgi:hypothetical protein